MPSFMKVVMTYGTKSSIKTSITNGVIVGGERIGSFIYESNKNNDILLSSRSDPFPAENSFGPIYLCTRNDDLEAIIMKTPNNRRADLVFLQNGMLGPYLNSKGLPENTQGLIYFAVSKTGEKPIDGITDVNPEGLTCVTEKWANDFTERMKAAGLTCHALEKDPLKVKMVIIDTL